MNDRQKWLRVGIESPVTRFLPRESDGYTAQLVCRQIFEPPFDIPLPGQPLRPLLFEPGMREFQDASGNSCYAVRLRPDLRFSDGRPVELPDLLAGLSGLEEECQVSVECEGHELIFRPAKPNPRFHLALTQTYWALARDEAGESLGTGPFRLLPDSTPDCIRLERNPYYREDVPLDGIEFLVYPPESGGGRQALVKALENGEVDLTTSLDQSSLPNTLQLRKWFDPGSSTGNLYFNTRRAPLDDPAVRRAIAMGINRRDLSAAAHGNALAFSAKGPLPPVMGEWLDDFFYDADAAANRLASLGVQGGSKMRMLVPWAPRPYLPNLEPIIEQLGKMFAYLGIELACHAPNDLRDFRVHVLKDDYDLALLGWNADTPDPADFLEVSLASHSIPEHPDSPVVKANWSRWSSGPMDAALARFRAEPEDVSGVNRARILALLAEEVPMMPLMYGPTLCVHRYGVRNFRPNPFGIPSLGEVDLWH